MNYEKCIFQGCKSPVAITDDYCKCHNYYTRRVDDNQCMCDYFCTTHYRTLYAKIYMKRLYNDTPLQIREELSRRYWALDSWDPCARKFHNTPLASINGHNVYYTFELEEYIEDTSILVFDTETEKYIGENT